MRCRLAAALLPLAALAAASGPVHAAPSTWLTVTYTGSATYSSSADASCYTDGGEYRKGRESRAATFRWDTRYDDAFVNPAQTTPINIAATNGVGENRRVSGTWTYQDPCTNDAGAIIDVDDLGKPNPLGTFLWAGISGQTVTLQAEAANQVGGAGRLTRFGTLGKTNGSSLGPARGLRVSGTGGLVATVRVPLARLRELGTSDTPKLVIPLTGPIAPWTPEGCDGSNCQQSLTWRGQLEIEASCARRVKTGPGYPGLSPEMKSALTKLYKRLDALRACYRFNSGFRSSDEQDALRDRWRGIADRRGAQDARTFDQVCAQLRASGFAQCPVRGTTGVFRDGQGRARGGPAVQSRHSSRNAADLTVEFPPKGERDLRRFQQAARAAGLCGPPASDPVHVELPYSRGKGKPVRCHFPEGPAP
jgi:hypothetical protein